MILDKAAVIKALRSLKLNNREIAELFDVSEQTSGNWMNGWRGLSAANAQKLAALCGVAVSSFYTTELA